MGAFGKEVIRTITGKPGRFLALLAIVALGAGFYAGLRMTAPDMRKALDEYLDEGRVYDVRVVSPIGFEDADFEALRNVDGVEDVMPAFQMDVLALLDETSYTMRLHSYPESAPSLGMGAYAPGCLNRLELYEGRWPEHHGECLIAADRVMAENADIGDSIVVTQEAEGFEGALADRQLTIVGKVHTPYYVSSAAIDASALGSGVVQQVLYVPETAFSDDMAYTDAFVAATGTRDLYCLGPEYDEAIQQLKGRIEGIAGQRVEARYESMLERQRSKLTTYDGLVDALRARLTTTSAQRDAMQDASWLVMDRTKNAGTASYTADAERVDHIARVFPTVFFLVAALVALTTMTRMVDEERRFIGICKALGYTRARITGKYLAYAALASGIGSVAGIAALGVLLPSVIMRAYAIMYYAPAGLPSIDVPIACLSTVLSMAITLAATWASAGATLREKPASLMVARVPKPGKRIVLERIRPPLVAPVVYRQGDVPQHSALQEEARHDRGRNRGMHGSAVDWPGPA